MPTSIRVCIKSVRGFFTMNFKGSHKLKVAQWCSSNKISIIIFTFSEYIEKKSELHSIYVYVHFGHIKVATK